MRPPPLALTCLFVMSTALGCAKKQENKPDPAATAEGATDPNGLDPSSAKDPLMRELLEVVQNCKINVEHSVISQCKDTEKRDLIRNFRRGDRDKMAALPTLAAALESEDGKLQTVSARILEGAYRASFGDAKPSDVDKDVAKRLVKTLPTLPKRQSNQVVGAVVHAAVLAGEREALFKALDGLTDKALKSTAYGYLLVHGGAPEVKKIVELASSDDRETVAAALQAARNFKRDEPELKADICEMARGKVSDADAIVSMRSAQILVTCSEKEIGELLDELEKRDKEKNITTGLVRSLYELCQEKKGVRYGTEAQCTRTRALIEKWIQDKTLRPEIRAAALFEIGVQFADEKSEKLCARFENDDELRVKTAAKEAVRRIQRKLGKPVVRVGATAPSGAGTRMRPTPSGLVPPGTPRAPVNPPKSVSPAPKPAAPKSTP